MTPFLIKNSVDYFYSPTLFIIEPKTKIVLSFFSWSYILNRQGREKNEDKV